MRKVFIVSILVVLFAAQAALAEPGNPQQQASRQAPRQEIFPEISTLTLKKRMDSATNFMLVDARPTGEYAQGHLPRAISVPPEMFGDIAGYLPKDKDIPVVFYCRGYG